MSLTGQLIDLSLVELIEFFCSQRKSGRLKVMYPQAPAYFYIQQGTLVDAKIGSLSGVEAVYYAMTLENASFKFSTAFEPTRRTIHQPWTRVALEGLRRIDEGIKPSEPFVADDMLSADEPDDDDDNEETASEGAPVKSSTVANRDDSSSVPLSLMVDGSAAPGRRNMFIFGTAAVILLISVTALGSFAGWFGKGKSSAAATTATQPDSTIDKTGEQATANTNPSEGQAAQPDASSEAGNAEASAPTESAAALAAKREREARERDRLKNNWPADQAQAAPASQPQANAPVPDAKKIEPPKPAQKTVTVQVTYDEAGRVTQASGGDPTALRIARQKRFPTGKAGSTTVTIPVN
jgi:hypothetical protein